MAIIAKPVINGKLYAWADMEIVVSGKVTPLVGVLEINYKVSQDHNPVHAKGRDPYAMTSGHKMYDGELVILQDELEAWQKKFLGGTDLTDERNLQINVAYLPEELGQSVVDQIKDARFGELEKGMKTGDGHMVVRLPFKALKINYGV